MNANLKVLLATLLIAGVFTAENESKDSSPAHGVLPDWGESFTRRTSVKHPATSDPVMVDWRVLIDIDYELRYFEGIDMKVNAPVFSEAVKELDKQEIIIEGFVIPLDAAGDRLALSLNPYAACFFCGKASPASVISLYLKNKGKKRYKIDEFVEFRGVLYLNRDDPNEFYYILREARER